MRTEPVNDLPRWAYHVEEWEAMIRESVKFVNGVRYVEIVDDVKEEAERREEELLSILGIC